MSGYRREAEVARSNVIGVSAMVRPTRVRQ
jgi:hypothetical protein